MKRLLLTLAALAFCVAAYAETITVATVNAWSGLTGRGLISVGEHEDRATRSFRTDLLVRGLLDLRPDIITLQEANPLPRFAESIGASLPEYDTAFSVRQAGVRVGPVGLPTNLREGEIILAERSRGLRQTATRQVAGPGAGDIFSFQLGTGTQIVSAIVEVAGRSVHVYTTRWTPSPHDDRQILVELVDAYARGELTGDELLSTMERAVTGSERRRREARETVAFINETAGRNPVILTGSLFALPDSAEMQVLRDAGFVDVWSAVGDCAGYTFDSASNANIIRHGLATGPGEQVRSDYILVRGEGIAARSARLILNTPTYGVHASAHYGIYAELRIDP